MQSTPSKTPNSPLTTPITFHCHTFRCRGYSSSTEDVKVVHSGHLAKSRQESHSSSDTVTQISFRPKGGDLSRRTCICRILSPAFPGARLSLTTPLAHPDTERIAADIERARMYFRIPLSLVAHDHGTAEGARTRSRVRTPCWWTGRDSNPQPPALYRGLCTRGWPPRRTPAELPAHEVGRDGPVRDALDRGPSLPFALSHPSGGRSTGQPGPCTGRMRGSPSRHPMLKRESRDVFRVPGRHPDHHAPRTGGVRSYPSRPRRGGREFRRRSRRPGATWCRSSETGSSRRWSHWPR